MKVQSGTYLEERVKAGEYGRIDIFSGHIEHHKGHNPFLTIRESDPGKTAERIALFCAQNLGDFTVYLRAYAGQAWSNAEMMRVHLSRVPAVQGAQPGTGNFDVEAEVQARLERIRNQEAAEKRLADLEAENQRLQDPLNKLAFVGEILLARFMGTAAPDAPAAAMQGTPDQDKAELQAAVAGLIAKFGKPGVIALNKKLDADPGAVAFVKNYAGI